MCVIAVFIRYQGFNRDGFYCLLTKDGVGNAVFVFGDNDAWNDGAAAIGACEPIGVGCWLGFAGKQVCVGETGCLVCQFRNQAVAVFGFIWGDKVAEQRRNGKKEH